MIDRYGIAPELIPDFVGLKGDTSDNIPGVPGIGEKTASQLLQEHGDLEGVLGNIENISGAKRKENLTNHAEDARISKQLAIRDIDLGEIDLDHIAARARPLAAARRLPRVRAARAARAAGGGARRGRGRRAGRARRGGHLHDRARVPLASSALSRASWWRWRPSGREPAGEQEGQEALDVGGPPLGPMRVAAYGGGEVLVAECETLTALTMARGERPACTTTGRPLR